jgi:hypothetical protein
LRSRSDGEGQTIGDADDIADTQTTGGSNEGLPSGASDRTQQEDLGGAAAPPLADEPRREDATAVENQQVARHEEIGQVPKGMVVSGAGPAVEPEKARGVALGRRRLGDALGRQLEIEVVDLQKSLFCAETGGGTRPKCW